MTEAFYGPEQQEDGDVFPQNQFAGAFGAKRQYAVRGLAWHCGGAMMKTRGALLFAVLVALSPARAAEGEAPDYDSTGECIRGCAGIAEAFAAGTSQQERVVENPDKQMTEIKQSGASEAQMERVVDVYGDCVKNCGGAWRND